MEPDRPVPLSVLDAAIAKGVHPETVRRAIRAGRLPARRIGQTFVIHPADLQSWQPHYEKASGRPAARNTPDTTATVRRAAQPERPLAPRLRGPSGLGAGRSHNVPVPPTPLVGREGECEAVRAFLARGGNRLVTLTGPGGAGKTRLALDVAARLIDAFEHGVWFVDLAPLHDPSLILATIAQTLGVRAPGRRPLREVLIDWLCQRRLLLVLDNCEHLLDGLPEVAALLSACGELKMLATSRAALHLAGEQVVPLQPLGVPDITCASTAEAISRSPAVALFVQRASAANPAFRLSDANVRAVAEVCVRLDGLPLAIELAAARVPAFSVEQIAARLDDRFRLLTADPRTTTPRQQTLQATVDWSYALLSEPERALLRRLSVFAGGWTLDAAEAVAAGDGLPPDTIADLLARLVDQSLVIAEERHGAMRYRLLETIRQSALDRLEDAGEAEPTQDRHLAYFLALAEEAEPQLRGAEQRAALERLEAEYANLRVALAWGLTPERGDEAALRLSGALLWFWYLRSYHDEGSRWLGQALAGTRTRSSARMKALHGAGWLAHHRRDSALARELLEESLAIARERDDRWTMALVLHHLGRVAYYDDDPVTARVRGEESLALAEEVGDDWLIAWALHLLGLAAHIAADYPTARAYYTRSLAIRRRLGYQLGLSILLMLLAIVAIREDDYGRAHELLRAGLAEAQDVQGPWGLAMPLAGFARVAAALAQPLRAVRLGAAATALSETYHTPLVPLFEVLLNEALNAASEQLDGDAHTAAWTEGRALPLEEAIAEAFAVEDVPPVTPAPPPNRRDDPGIALTSAEFRVLRLVASGLTTKEIAVELAVATSTVDRHLTHIYTKLGVRNRAEATAVALRQELI